LETRSLHVEYDGVEVLRDVNFRVEPGEYVGIVGPNGSGKTTLIRTVLGLKRPGRGEVRLFDHRPGGRPDSRRVGYLPQMSAAGGGIFPATAREIVATGRLAGKRFPRWLGRADRRAVEEILRELEIEGLAARRIGQLSGGQRQRVLLARALVSDPQMLLLDEPTSSLDPTTRSAFYGLLKTLHREQGKTILFVTHDTGTIGEHADKLLYIDREVVFYGTFEAFCRSERMTEYFGASAQHVICHRHGKDG
jgi:zinc transport system ATP-binding protein